MHTIKERVMLNVKTKKRKEYEKKGEEVKKETREYL